MHDVQQLKESVDCRNIVEQDLGAPKYRHSTYNLYRCPLHREVKGKSLAVYKDGWKCYGKCNKVGDVMTWLQEYRGLSFREAYHELGGHFVRTPTRKPETQRSFSQSIPAEPPSAEWQAYARQFIDQAETILWSEQGRKALDYLKHKRGLVNVTIQDARLGYLPASSTDDYKYGRVLYPDWRIDDKPVRAHCGIIVPHFADGQLWQVRVRRPPGVEGSKYTGLRGGSKALYRIDDVQPRYPVVISEGEFDALILDQCCGWHEGAVVSSIALASASNHHLDSRWLDKLISAPVIMTRFDNDGAGEKATESLKMLSSRVRPIHVPAPHKDVNDFYLAEGAVAVRTWLEGVMS